MKKSKLNFDAISRPPYPPFSALASLGEEHFINENINEPFWDLVKDKRVAIVGPASSIVGASLGSKIDGYDIVCRVNQREPIHESNYDDFGTRTDILTVNANCYAANVLIKNLEWIKSVEWFLTWGRDHGDWDKIKSTPPNHHEIPRPWVINLNRIVGTTSNTGLLNITWLAQYDIKELFVVGFSFYNMGEWGNCYNDAQFKSPYYRSYHPWNELGIITPEGARADIHDIDRQITYFRKLLAVHLGNPITLDPYLTQHFGTL